MWAEDRSGTRDDFSAPEPQLLTFSPFIQCLILFTFKFILAKPKLLLNHKLSSPQPKLSAHHAGVTVSPVCVTYCPPLAICIHLQASTVAG